MKACSVEGCGRAALTRGYCDRHYRRVLKFGDPQADIPIQRRQPAVGLCSVEDCEERAKVRGYCASHYNKASWRSIQADPERRERQRQLDFASGLKRHYGITPDDWHAMLVEQAGRCAICAEAFDDSVLGRRAVHIDHGHATGVVRGLLCSECNLGLGKFRDSPATAIAAAGYLLDQLPLIPRTSRARGRQ